MAEHTVNYVSSLISLTLLTIIGCGFALAWLNRKLTDWRCEHGMHDWECGLGPCLDCGKPNPDDPTAQPSGEVKP